MTNQHPFMGQAARFRVPQPLPDLIHRPRLLQALRDNAHRKLTLITAAAGYGKTSLLVDYVRGLDCPVAWCRLDEADQDLAALVDDLVRALQVPFPDFASSAPAGAAQPGALPARLGTLLARDIEANIDSRFVLVLDDCHLAAEAQPVIRFINALLARLPQPAHLIVAGRVLPELDLPTLAVQQAFGGLDEAHLRFTAGEVNALLKARGGPPLPAAEAEALVAETEGWVAGILLSAGVAQARPLAELMRARPRQAPLFEYLAAQVLAAQAGPLRQFLLESAVLPDMESAACDSVLGRSGSAALLEQAVERHLFISVVGDEFRSYHYHHLFRDFLVAQLRAEAPGRLSELQRRAAAWFAAGGLFEAAVTYYLAGGEPAQAAAVAEEHVIDLYLKGRYEAMRRWSEQLAAHTSPASRVHVYLCKVHLDSGDLERAEAELDQAEADFAHSGSAIGRLEADTQRSLVLYRRGRLAQALALAQDVATRARALGQLATEALAWRYAGLCQLALHQLAAAEASLERGVQLLEQRATVPTGRYDLAWAYHDLALVLRVRGQTARAARAQQAALRLWRDPLAPGPLAMALNNISWDQHMLGQFEAALATYREALDWARRADASATEALILTGMGDLWADLGDTATAKMLYHQAMAQAERLGDWVVTVFLCRGLAQLDRRAGRFANALEWLRRAELASGRAQSPSALEDLDRLYGVLALEMGDPAQGRARLAEACARLQASEALADLAAARLHLACAHWRLGEPGPAEAALRLALDAAEQVGYYQMMVVEVPAARDVLEAFAGRPDLGPRVQTIMRQAEEIPARRMAMQGAVPAVVPVPAAELEIYTLGRSRVMRGSAEVAPRAWGGQRTKEIFLFIVDRSPVARDLVLDAFWEGKTLAQAANNLDQVLFRVRRALGIDIVGRENGLLHLAPDVTISYDVARFEAAAREAFALPSGDLRRVGRLATAVASYTGDYLADLPVEWAGARQRQLSDLRVRLLAEYADELMAVMRSTEARQALEAALAVEPLRDDLHGRMLTCLHALGLRHLVVSHFCAYRDLMRTELGLEPSPDVSALYARLIQ